MDAPNWTELTGIPPIKANPGSGICWTKAYDHVQGPALLKIVATGEWYYSTKFNLACSANGDLMSPLNPTRCIYEKSPVGALIGKIAGSVADKDSSSVFVVGSECVRKLDQERGPLFLTINDMWTGFGDNYGELNVQIFLAQVQ
jgi:hypothetical protein